ncbi:uncharacterized protein LOC124280697 [Haliotis rubra]|uniref:uncharacterized protein LOC124280697 n=1 Tax=Haliotis rubra TaxID=36100 RepID=UPI001EE5D171|nr:uncharacterized protein LOC124280697 [Haliotis rubra]
MRGLLSLLTLTATLVCLLTLPDETQSRRVDRQRRHANRARRDASPEIPIHRSRRDASPEIPIHRSRRDASPEVSELRNKRDTSSFPSTTEAPYSSAAAEEVQRVVRDFLVDAIKYAESKADDENGGSWTEAILEFLLKELQDSGNVEGTAEEDLRKDLVTRFGGENMESHLRQVAKQIENGEVTSNHHHHGTQDQHHSHHGAAGNHGGIHHNPDSKIHGKRGHGTNHHGGHGTAQEHTHGHRPEHTNGVTSTSTQKQHHQGHHGQHQHTEGTDQLESTESFTQQDDFEFTPESIRSHVRSFLENMNPQQINSFLVFLDNIEAEQVFKDGEIAFIPSGAIKAHINMVFDKLEAANDTHAERALRVMLHYLHGFEYSEFHKLQGSYTEDPTLEYARGFALGMVDKLLAEHGEEEIQTSLAEMEHLLDKFEKHFSIDPLHTEHKRHHHHGDGPPATAESVTALVNKVFGEIENNADKSERHHELKIIAQILHSFTGHHGHQREHLETDVEGLVTVESVKGHALKLVQTLQSHKQTRALADLANMLVFFEAKASDTQPDVHFEEEFQGESPASSHNANVEPAAAMKLVDKFIERYVAMKDDAQLTTILRSIVAYFVEFEKEEKQRQHNGNNLHQKDDDVDGSEDEAEVSTAVPEGNTRNEPNTNPSVHHLPTIGNRGHGIGTQGLGGFAAAPEKTGVGSGIPGRGGTVGSHHAPQVPHHTFGHRAFR